MSLLFPRKNPSLPQNDTAGAQARRKSQLFHSQQSYVWDTHNVNVGPVPMAKSVPKEASPTLTWSINVISVIVPIVENLVANVKDDAKLVEIKANFADVLHAVQSVKAGGHWPLINHTSNLLKDLVSLFQTLVKQDLNEDRSEIGLKAYREQFQTLDLPSVADVFQQNQSFARYRIAGPNPMLIAAFCQPMSHFSVSDEGYQQVMGIDDSIDKAMTEKRLFILDYKELSVLVDNPQAVDKRVCAPIALFAISKGSTELKPVAIQMSQDATAPIVYAEESANNTPAYWQWQAAMSTVQVADGNYHELFVHLGRTHLLNEAFAVATERQLAQVHPLNLLLYC